MDFLGCLPIAKKGHNYLFMTFNMVSKVSIIIACKRTMSNKLIVYIGLGKILDYNENCFKEGHKIS